MRGIWLFPVLLLLFSCDGPERRLHRLQRELLTVLPEREAFMLVEKKDTVWLPLPPTEADLQRVQAFARQHQSEVGAIEWEKMPADQQPALARLRLLLDSLSSGAALPLPDPARYLPEEALRRSMPPVLLVSLVDTLPAYYTAVHQRWAAPISMPVAPALNKALLVLERLDALENNLENLPAPYRARLAAALPAARRAVKDYIGLCQSAVLK